jgi:hypothetical protein
MPPTVSSAPPASDVDFTQIATAARALGLNIPEALLATAGEVIQRTGETAQVRRSILASHSSATGQTQTNRGIDIAAASPQ